ncbi:ABC transporter ATP-binding protein [Salipiger abyssi]|uniref:ABC transporter ATP-binding protein n=1 Tax=Salipiger abyssi TaxID=1250539 RepID=UPI004058F654
MPRDISQTGPILEVEGLHTILRTSEGIVRAVTDVSITVERGEIVGIVGESGCGKSMTAMSIMGLVPTPPGDITEGRILLDGSELRGLGQSAFQKVRGRRIAMIFQDPMTYLNPVLTIGTQIDEMLRQHMDLDRAGRARRVIELLRRVRIPDPERVAAAYPHQLSGGMRQRVLIATAISCDPELIIADEPTTALDVTVQAQVLELLKEIIRDMGSSLILITHDLGVVAETCDRVYVMYAGRVIEEAPMQRLFEQPGHPYTQGLLASILRADQPVEELYALDGTVPNLTAPPKGCAFCDRCAVVMDICHSELPPRAATGPRAFAACWRIPQ